MKVSRFDVEHHKIMMASRGNLDTTELQRDLNKKLDEALDNKCPEAECFFKRLKARQPLVLRKNNSKIMKFIKNFINKLNGE